MEDKPQFFDFAAEVGLTKHIGGVEATDSLIDLCHITPDSYILDVGCGAGLTPVYIVKKVGCKVVGVDIMPKMVERSKEAARREGVSDLTEFKVADAQDLPFEDNIFDAVITESVTAFPPDKQKAVDEYARVTKPGGYIGLNETTWIKVPVPQEVIEWASQEVGASVQPQTPEEWTGLLKKSGLKDIVAKTFPVDMKVETKGILQRYGLRGMLRTSLRAFRLYLKSPHYREFLKGVGETGLTPENLTEYFGYGLFIGKK
ncbi:MAG: class I SAM-dependent methyltransferase [Anaerolineales bacterium]|jgi:ubiquinone/menaquinone biosynthesis C-methylase UbiE